jgi:hypothetical protein
MIHWQRAEKLTQKDLRGEAIERSEACESFSAGCLDEPP